MWESVLNGPTVTQARNRAMKTNYDPSTDDDSCLLPFPVIPNGYFMLRLWAQILEDIGVIEA